MAVFNSNTFSLFHKPSFSASLESGKTLAKKTTIDILPTDRIKERIRRLFDKVELSTSSYDTAWVAMVPSPHHVGSPCFPGCLNWILDNQLCDGSWGHSQYSDPLLKDDLSSTLACILALKRWGVGEEQINRGLHFLQLNFDTVTDKNQISPIGFDIIFTGMLEYAKTLGLKLPMEPRIWDDLLNNRALELRRYSESYSLESESCLAYLSEGMGKSQNWEMVMKYQRKNGSLFNSPSTTAAALNHLQNTDCLNYLRSVLEKFRDAVPTIYPLDIYARLCMVDNLEKLGIDRHFRKEIRIVLDETYSYWLQEDEQIFLDVATCALAFRILRMNGYDVSSDTLTQIAKEKYYLSSLGEDLKNTSDALELYRASQLILHPDESALGKQKSWSGEFLKQKLSYGSVHSHRYAKYVFQEVEEALKFPIHANLERMVNKRNIEHFNVDSTRVLKASYRSSNISNTDFLRLAVEDFNGCQSLQREELKCLERWVVDNKLDTLRFARQKAAYCFFSAAATLFPPELSVARMSWAKNGVLTTVVDDFFDVGGSIEELLNLIQLVEKQNVNVETDCCSEQVCIIFSAIHSTICEIGNHAFNWQGRQVTRRITEIWLDLLKSMLKESQWTKDNTVPTLDEYMENGYVSFALGPIVLPALYLVGPKLSEDDVQNAELHNLYKLMSTSGRLLNDIQGFKRESTEGKLNAVSLRMIHGTDAVTKEEAIGDIKRSIDGNTRELLRLVLLEKGSVVPRACKDLFWKMCRVLHLFYANDDGFTSNKFTEAVKAVVYEPISLDNK